MNKRSLDALIENLDLGTAEVRGPLDARVTLCMSRETKSKYGELQDHTNQRFCENLRQAVELFVDQAHAKISKAL